MWRGQCSPSLKTTVPLSMPRSESGDWLWGCVDLGEGVSGPKVKKMSKKSWKSLPGPGHKNPKKVSKKVRKLNSDLCLTFRTLFGTFFRLLGPGPQETFSRLFWRLVGFWPRDSLSQVHGTSRLAVHGNFKHSAMIAGTAAHDVQQSHGKCAQKIGSVSWRFGVFCVFPQQSSKIMS